jgi:hypothetical protein
MCWMRWRAKAGFRSLKDTCADSRPLDARSFGPQSLTLDYHDPEKLAVHNGTSCTVAATVSSRAELTKAAAMIYRRVEIEMPHRDIGRRYPGRTACDALFNRHALAGRAELLLHADQ